MAFTRLPMEAVSQYDHSLNHLSSVKDDMSTFERMLPLSTFMTTEPKRKNQAVLNTLGAMLNLLISAMGTSLVAAAYVYNLTTPFAGICIQLVLAVLACLGAICLFNSSKETGATSFFDLGDIVFERYRFRRVINVFLVAFPFAFTLIGCLSAYIVIASNIITGYLPQFSVLLVKLALAAVMLALGLIRSFDGIKYLSLFCYCATMVFTLLLISATVIIMPYVAAPLGTFSVARFLSALPILGVGLNGHSVIPGMVAELNPNAYELTSYIAVGALGLTALISTSLGFTGSYILGNAVEDDLVAQLFTLSKTYLGGTSTIVVVAQILLGCVIIIKSPLTVVPLKEIVLFKEGVNVKERSYFAHALAAFSIVSVSAFLAIALEDLSAILNIVAGIGSIFIVQITPGVFSLMIEKGRIATVRSGVVLASGIFLLFVDILNVAGVLKTS